MTRNLLTALATLTLASQELDAVEGARTATLHAATDLFGSGSTEYNAVAAAWSAVSVN